MKFAELAGNMWDDAGALVLEMVKKRGNTIITISRGREGQVGQGHRAGDRRLDQAGEGQGPRRRQAARAGQGAGGQVRQGLSVRRRARSHASRAAARCRGSRVASMRQTERPGGGELMSDAGAAAQPELRPPLIERAVGRHRVLGGLLSLCMAALVVVSVIGPRRLRSTAARSTATSSWCRWRRRSPSSASCPIARRAAATSSSTRSRPGCRARATACIDAFWDLVYAGMMGADRAAAWSTGALEHFRSGQTTMLLQLHRLAGAWRVCAALSRRCVALRRLGDRGPADSGARHERRCHRRPSASARCCC